MFLWFAGLPSQKWVWPSMTKISSPLAVLYMGHFLIRFFMFIGAVPLGHRLRDKP